MRPARPARPADPHASSDDHPGPIPITPQMRWLAHLTGIEPSVMQGSWYADQARATVLVIALFFIFGLQWVIWAAVAAQILPILAAVLVGMFPPIGLALFDRLVVLPDLWSISAEARAALNISKPDLRAVAARLAVRVLVSLTFAWVAADYLVLAVESESLLAHEKARAAEANRPLFDELERLKRQQYADTVAPLVGQRAQLNDQIAQLADSRQHAERVRGESEAAAQQAFIEKGRQEDGFGGDGQHRKDGQGTLFREARRQEVAARQAAQLNAQRVADAQREQGQLQRELQRVDAALAAAELTHRAEVARLEQALPHDPRFAKPVPDLMSMRQALAEVSTDPVKGPIVRKHTLELEAVVLLLDLLLIFVKWGPHSGSYAVRFAAAQRIEIAETVRDANARIERTNTQRPEFRIVERDEA